MSGRGATLMAAAFALSALATSVPSLIVTALAAAEMSVPTLITAAIVLDLAGFAVAYAILGLALRAIARPAPAEISWPLVIGAAVAALLAYPLGTAAAAGTSALLARGGMEALAEWTMASVWRSAAGQLGHVVWLLAAVVGAAVVWHRQAREGADREPALLD